MSIINKKKLNELLALSNDPKIELIEDSSESYKIIVTGDKNKVKKSEFQLILDELRKINSRLDVLETKVNQMMDTPTMKNELAKNK